MDVDLSPQAVLLDDIDELLAPNAAGRNMEPCQRMVIWMVDDPSFGSGRDELVHEGRHLLVTLRCRQVGQADVFERDRGLAELQDEVSRQRYPGGFRR